MGNLGRDIGVGPENAAEPQGEAGEDPPGDEGQVKEKHPPPVALHHLFGEEEDLFPAQVGPLGQQIGHHAVGVVGDDAGDDEKVEGPNEGVPAEHDPHGVEPPLLPDGGEELAEVRLLRLVAQEEPPGPHPKGAAHQEAEGEHHQGRQQEEPPRQHPEQPVLRGGGGVKEDGQHQSRGVPRRRGLPGHAAHGHEKGAVGDRVGVAVDEVHGLGELARHKADEKADDDGGPVIAFQAGSGLALEGLPIPHSNTSSVSR